MFLKINKLKDSILYGIFKKEFIQMRRDPSSILIAIALPLLWLFLYGYGITLDPVQIKIGIGVSAFDPLQRDFVSQVADLQYFDADIDTNHQNLLEGLYTNRYKAVLLLPENFSKHIMLGRPQANPQVITDGSEPNTSYFIQNYINGILSTWYAQYALQKGEAFMPPISLEYKFWYNPEAKSRYYLLPGALAIIMMFIGTLLTSIVIAREWERGTMESLLASRIKKSQLILGKLLPYFVLGMFAAIFSIIVNLTLFQLPFHGSVINLILMTSAFLFVALSLGLLISTITRNQFVASQLAMTIGFLPSFLLSGFLFEIRSMPEILQWITLFVPARYFVASLQTLFIAGDIYSILVPNFIVLILMGCGVSFLVYRKMDMRL